MILLGLWPETGADLWSDLAVGTAGQTAAGEKHLQDFGE